MTRRAQPIDTTPAVRPERWTVTSKATGETKTVEARLAIEAWKVAQLRDGLGVLLPYSAVRVAPAADETTASAAAPRAPGGTPCNGQGKPARSHKSSARRGAKAASPPVRSAPEPSSLAGRGGVDGHPPSPAAAAPVRRNGHKHPRAEGSR